MGFIRLILAMLVMQSHYDMAFFDTMPGYVAVKVFFAISGFYMSLVLAGAYRDAPKAAFYAARFLRLYPPYLLVALASALLVWGAGMTVFAGSDMFATPLRAGPVPALTVVLPNLFIFGQEGMYLVNPDPDTFQLAWAMDSGSWGDGMYYLLLPQGWSLAVEMAFYLLAPFVVRFRWGWAACLMLASLGLRVFMDHALQGGDVLAQRFFPAQLYLFMAGNLAFRVYARIKDSPWTLWAGMAALPVWAAMLLACGKRCDDWPGQVVLLACSAVFLPLVFRLTRASVIDRFAGNLSYPFYLLQFVAIGLHMRFMPETGEWLALPVCFLLALVLHLGFERPLNRVRARVAARLSGRGRGAPPLPEPAAAQPALAPALASPRHSAC